MSDDEVKNHIPYGCVSHILITHESAPDFPFFSGTGFFVLFPPYEQVFFITARHCVIGPDGDLIGKIEVPLEYNTENPKKVIFSEYLEVQTGDDEKNYDDVIVFVVSPRSNAACISLKNRCLFLQHQDNVDYIINHIIENNETVKSVGFPGISKEMNYDKKLSIVSHRGLYGKIIERFKTNRNMFSVKASIWSDGPMDGFSGSPVFALAPTNRGNVAVIPLGIITNANHEIFNFININIISDLIGKYIVKKMNECNI
jgi:hypothetical protein